MTRENKLIHLQILRNDFYNKGFYEQAKRVQEDINKLA